MIECSNQNYGYKKRKKPLRFFKLIFILSIIFFVWYYYSNVVTKQIVAICENYSKIYATKSVNSAVLENLSYKINYTDLITIEKNSSGDISLMSANVYKINYISREIEKSTFDKLDTYTKNGYDIPLFAFSGINIFSGYGPKVRFNAVSLGNVKCEFVSDFVGVGINQTIHKIYIEISSTVFINFIGANKENTTTTKVMICESVIVGKVPDTYLSGKLFNN